MNQTQKIAAVFAGNDPHPSAPWPPRWKPMCRRCTAGRGRTVEQTAWCRRVLSQKCWRRRSGSELSSLLKRRPLSLMHGL